VCWYKHSSYLQNTEDNYLLSPIGLGANKQSAFNAQGDVSEPYFNMMEVAIPHPA
jgi:hypothetical protein